MIDPIAAVPGLTLASVKAVANVFPTIPSSYRLAIVGGAPNEASENYDTPFAGASGDLLTSLLNQSGVMRASCFLGYVCQHRPPNDSLLDWRKDNDSRIAAGMARLEADLAEFKPNCILIVGSDALSVILDRTTSADSWRGSIISTRFGKAVVTIDPRAVLQSYSDWPLLRFDCARARKQAEFPDLRLPQRNLLLHLPPSEICNRLDNWPSGAKLSFDIEGGLDAFPCCSVAGATNEGFIIAWSKYSEADQGRVAVSLSRVLYREDVPKVLQNSLYDRFVLAYGYRMLIRNVTEDTMDKSWAIYSELPKGLGTICSIWTEEPFYKSDRKTDDEDTYHRYCIKDSCVTLEACLAMDRALSPREEKHYRFNVALKNPLLYMELRGFRYATEQVALDRAQIQVAMDECANRLSLRCNPVQWNKKEFTSDMRGKKGSLSAQRVAKVLYEQKGYTPQFKGRGATRKITADVEALLNLCKKYKSDAFLHDILLHRKLEGVRKTLNYAVDPDGRIRCSYNQFSKGEDDEVEEGGGSTETGRLRCSQSITGSGGNLTTITKKLRKHYLADVGYNLFQCDLSGADGWTVAAHCLRHGDPTMWDDYQAGLKPAKIVALMMKYSVDATKCSRDELKDRCEEVDGDGAEYFVCKVVQHGSNYLMQGKMMQTNVMTKSYKITGTPLYVDVSYCEGIQRLYFVRYGGVYQWHEWAKRQVLEGKHIISASGHERKFFGRRKSWDARRKCMVADRETLGEFLADEPQENTTFATNLAIYNLWYDDENRFSSYVGVGSSGYLERFRKVGGDSALAGLQTILSEMSALPDGLKDRAFSGLLIEPLHQVHDAALGQNRKEIQSWATPKIRGYFNNVLHIADTNLVIPFEGGYGPSWGELGPKYDGGYI